jgi:hypothetical protein
LGDRAGERNKNATNDEQTNRKKKWQRKCLKKKKKKEEEIFIRFDRTWAEDESLQLCLAKRKREKDKRLEMC